MTFNDLMRLHRIGDPQVSPGGHWVIFSSAEVDLEKNAKVSHLWAVPLPQAAAQQASAPAREHQITFWKEGESGGRFSPDGKQVLFIATDSATGLSQIFLASWNEADGTLGTPQRLTNISTEADGAIWSPDSKRILFTSRVYPECSTQDTWLDEDNCNRHRDAAAAANPVKAQIWDHLLYRHWDHFVGDKRSHILVVSAADGNAVRDLTPRTMIGDAEAPTFSLGGPLGYAWSPDSQEIAFVTNPDLIPAVSTNNEVYTLRLDQPGTMPVKISTSPGSDDAPAYSPDGRYLAFRSQARAAYESDLFRLMLYDRQTKTTLEPMKGTLNRWVNEFVWSPDSRHILFGSDLEGEAPFAELRVDSSHPSFQTRTDLPGEFSDLQVLSGGAVVTTRMMVDRPAEIVTVAAPADDSPRSFASARLSVLTHLNDPLIATLDLPKMESFWFTGAENAKVQGFLIRPPGFNPARRYPVKFLIHGGPQGAWGDAWSYRWNPELMAADGYVVVMVNPRGSIGYGQAFIDGINGDWGGKPYLDLMKGLDFAEQHYPFLDKTRECALGASYGGYMADWILTHTDRFSCIVTHDGMFNPQSAYGSTEELWFNEWEFRRPGDKEPGQPWRYADGPIAADPFRKWSPMLSIRNAKTPTLVIHSQHDYRLDVSEGFQLFTALQRLDVPSKMLYFPDEGHWILKPQNSRLWNQTVSEWCDRWTHTNEWAVAALSAPLSTSPPAPLSAQPSAPPPAKPRAASPAPPARPAPAPPLPAPAPRTASQPPAQTAAPPASSSGTFSISIAAPQATLAAGANARLLIILKNNSGHQLLFSHRPGNETPEFSFKIEVRSSDGHTAPETAYARTVSQGPGSTVEYIQPGGSVVQTAHLAKLYNLTRPGQYTVVVTRKDGAAVIRSNQITLTVTR